MGRLSVRFFQGDERFSIDWEDGLRSYRQKSQVNICYKKISKNIYIPFFLSIDKDSLQDFAAGCHSYGRLQKNTAE